jgi:hypothetical protein
MADRTGTPQAPLAHGDDKEHRRQIAQRANQALPKSGSEPMLGNLDMGGFNLLNAANLAFAQSVGGSGYVKLPGGVIIQGSQAVTDSAGEGTATYPTAFPNACWAVVLNDRNGATGRLFTTGTPGLSTCAVFTSAVSTTASYIAIGY